MWNMISDLSALKKIQSNFFLSRIWLFDALKRTQKINPKGVLNKRMKKPRLQFNLGFMLIGLRSTWPWVWCRSRNKRKWKYWRIFHTLASLLLWKIVLLWWFVFSDTEGTGEIGNSKSSFNHFITSTYFKNCKMNREWCGFFFVPQCTRSVYTESRI